MAMKKGGHARAETVPGEVCKEYVRADDRGRTEMLDGPWESAAGYLLRDRDRIFGEDSVA